VPAAAVADEGADTPVRSVIGEHQPAWTGKEVSGLYEANFRPVQAYAVNRLARPDDAAEQRPKAAE
jgi:hypothetical protein